MINYKIFWKNEIILKKIEKFWENLRNKYRKLKNLMEKLENILKKHFRQINGKFKKFLNLRIFLKFIIILDTIKEIWDSLIHFQIFLWES